VDVWGAYVFDSQHGYFEIHPVFSMSTSSDGGETWSDTYTSGPQYGGPPRRAPNAHAFTQHPKTQAKTLQNRGFKPLNRGQERARGSFSTSWPLLSS
jgi:hypothetical protein